MPVCLLASVSRKHRRRQDREYKRERNDKGERRDIPSQGSGSVLAARSSMENLTSWPFSRRDSGSAFRSQYCLSPGAAAVVVVVFDFAGLRVSLFVVCVMG